MGLDCIAFYESRAGVAALANIAGLADSHVTVSGDNITVPEKYNKILATLSFGEHGGTEYTDQLQLSSPSLKGRGLLDLSDYVDGYAASGTYPGNNPPMDVFADSPVPLQSGEVLSCLEKSSGTSTEAKTVVVFLTDGSRTAVAGDIIHVKCTSSITATAHAWTSGTLTFTQSLRAGRWGLVGCKAAGATMGAARFIFPSGPMNESNRPGVPGCVSLRNYVDPARGLFRNGNLGIWGTFMDHSPPQVEILCAAADTSQDYVLDLIYLGEATKVA